MKTWMYEMVGHGLDGEWLFCMSPRTWKRLDLQMKMRKIRSLDLPRWRREVSL
jgi:hypothetical protein